MVEKQGPENAEGPQNQSNSAPKSVEFNVGGNIEKSVVVIGDNNVIHYYSVVENNVEKHEPDFWGLKHPYPMPPNFTGRVAERATLTHWLKEDSENRLFILRALGGFGKSALAWQWLTHDVDIKEYPKVVFWSFYEGDASFEHFIEETLKYLKLEIHQGQRLQVDELLKAMQAQKILLIMDGFERALRAYSSMNAAYQGDESPLLEGEGKGEGAYDCVNINAEIFLKSVCSLPNIKSKVLMTTRLTPRAVKPRGEFMLGCREEELTAMQKADAVEFFHKQKIKGTHTEIEAACAPYGYHPLSLRILTGLIANDREKPGNIAVAGKLDITDNIVQNKNHVLKVSYETLSFAQQKLLSNMACFRSSTSYEVLRAITTRPSWKRKSRALPSEKLDDSLAVLESRGLLNWDRRVNKYDLHPIVRRYAYDRLTVTDRRNAHKRLINYFEVAPKPQNVKTIEDLTPVIELYHHMVRAGNLDEAEILYRTRLQKAVYYQLGRYQLQIELLLMLFIDSKNELPHLKEESAQSWILNELANSYALSGQPYRSTDVFIKSIKMSEKLGEKMNLAIGLGNVAYMAQLHIGALRDAEQNLHRSIELCREIEDEFWEATGYNALARVLSYCGKWIDAEQLNEKALSLIKKLSSDQAEGAFWAYRSLNFLQMARAQASDNQSPENNITLTIQFASHALELADKVTEQRFPYTRDYIRAYWLLGAAYRANNELDKAEESLSKAINLCRQINMVDHEANILLDLARLRYDQKNYEEAKSLADEALTITERCGYILQGADVNLFLAQFALEQEKDKVKAKQYAETALKLATCDGPPYYYKVAYEEAERMLERLKAE